MNTTIDTFLNLLWPDNIPEGHLLNLWYPKGDGGVSRWCSNLDGAATVIGNLRDRHDVYLGCGLMPRLDKSRSPSTRGKSKEISAIPGLWADLDVTGATHSENGLWPSKPAAADWLNGLERPPTLLVDSGGGLHAWWLFDEPWIFESDSARQRAAVMLRDWQALLSADAPYPVDTTHDLARILRPVGSFNRKRSDPLPVQIFHTGGHRYAVEELSYGHGVPAEEPPQKSWRFEATGATNQPGWEAGWLRTPIAADHGRRAGGGLPKMVGSLLRHDYDVETAVAILEMWDAQNPAPLGADEVRSHVESMYRRYQTTADWGENGSVTEPDDVAPKFPVDALPETVRNLVREGAAASDVPPELVALPLLGIMAGLIGPNARIQVKRSWIETPQLWLAVVAQPGRGKTPAESHARMGLEVIQKEAYERYSKAEDDYEKVLTRWEQMPEETRGPRPEKPRLENFYADDMTMEALADMLTTRPGLVVLRDELTTWVGSYDAYRGGRGSDRSKWLSSWSGVPLKVNRKTGKPLLVAEPSISVAGGIQPDMLSALADDAHRRDGFVERILYSWPDDHIPGWVEDDISEATAVAVEQQMRRIAEMGKIEQPVQFSPEARQHWIAWMHHNNDMLGEVSGILGGIYAKMPNQLARLALVLHVLETTQNLRDSISSITSIISAIELDTLKSAIELVEYFRSHAHRVVPALGEDPGLIAGLSPEQSRILTYHRDHGAATSQQVAEVLGLRMDSVNHMQRKLVDRKRLYQPAYGVYDLAESNSTYDRTDRSDRNSQNLSDTTEVSS